MPQLIDGLLYAYLCIEALYVFVYFFMDIIMIKSVRKKMSTIQNHIISGSSSGKTYTRIGNIISSTNLKFGCTLYIFLHHQNKYCNKFNWNIHTTLQDKVIRPKKSSKFLYQQPCTWVILLTFSEKSFSMYELKCLSLTYTTHALHYKGRNSIKLHLLKMEILSLDNQN